MRSPRGVAHVGIARLAMPYDALTLHPAGCLHSTPGAKTILTLGSRLPTDCHVNSAAMPRDTSLRAPTLMEPTVTEAAPALVRTSDPATYAVVVDPNGLCA